VTIYQLLTVKNFRLNLNPHFDIPKIDDGQFHIVSRTSLIQQVKVGKNNFILPPCLRQVSLAWDQFEACFRKK
jgi:hypothetical protein